MNKEIYHWLYDDIEKLKEKIEYRDKIIYKVGGKYHNHTGPAIIYKYDPLYKTKPILKDEYYLKGERLEKEVWEKYLRLFKIKSLVKKINKE